MKYRPANRPLLIIDGVAIRPWDVVIEEDFHIAPKMRSMYDPPSEYQEYEAYAPPSLIVRWTDASGVHHEYDTGYGGKGSIDSTRHGREIIRILSAVEKGFGPYRREQ